MNFFYQQVRSKVYLKYQRYEKVHSCFGAEKSEFPDIPDKLVEQKER